MGGFNLTCQAQTFVELAKLETSMTGSAPLLGLLVAFHMFRSEEKTEKFVLPTKHLIPRDKCPCFVQQMDDVWGVLHTQLKPPSIIAEFDSEKEALDYVHAFNRDFWLKFDSARLTYWTIEQAKRHDSSSLDRLASSWKRLKRRVRFLGRNDDASHKSSQTQFY